MYPSTDPFDHGSLVRPDGAELYWEASGNPRGAPALHLHGGPGSGLGRGGYRRKFDPDRFMVIGLDQRGCGRSRPWAIDDLAHLDANTTQAVISDIEALRDHLGVTAWVVHGVSWGSTLALAYALEHSDRVTGLVLTAVTSGSREEIDWLTEGVGTVFPEAWQRFASAASDGERVVEAYAGLLRSPDPRVRSEAAEEWDRWESTHVSLDPAWRPGRWREDPRERENTATLVTHYWAHDCFLTGQRRVINRAHELDPIPGVLIHGRHDVSGPAITPWRLHQRWESSTLTVVEAEGHGGAEMSELSCAALDALARRS